MIVREQARRRLKFLGYLLIECIDFITEIKENSQKLSEFPQKIASGGQN